MTIRQGHGRGRRWLRLRIIRALERLYRLALKSLQALSLILLFLTSAVSGLLALNGIGEIDARRQFRALLQDQIAQKQTDLAAISAKSIPLTIEGYGPDRLQSDIVDLNDALTSLRQLSESGAVAQAQTLRGVQLRFTDPRYSHSVIVEENAVHRALATLDYVPEVMRDDSVLAGVVLFSSIFGTCLAALRGRKPTWTELAAGSVAGILVFLLIKGGKVLFLLGDDGQWAQYNPYSFAFAGVLAGLFSESAFKALGAATESVFDRFARSDKKEAAAT